MRWFWWLLGILGLSGMTWWFYDGSDGEDFEEDPGEEEIAGEDAAAKPNKRIKGAELIEQASKYIGAKYKWGGAKSKAEGLDCSGLFYRAARDLGVEIPRTARAQARACRMITEDEAKSVPGAFVFLSKAGKPAIIDNIFHVEASDGSGKYVLAAQVKKGVKLYKWGWWGQKYGLLYGTLPHLEEEGEEQQS